MPKKSFLSSLLAQNCSVALSCGEQADGGHRTQRNHNHIYDKSAFNFFKRHSKMFTTSLRKWCHKPKHPKASTFPNNCNNFAHLWLMCVARRSCTHIRRVCSRNTPSEHNLETTHFFPLLCFGATSALSRHSLLSQSVVFFLSPSATSLSSKKPQGNSEQSSHKRQKIVK